MTLSEKYAGSNGTWGTEFSLSAGSTSIQARTSAGLYAAWIDSTNLARGDVYVLRAYEKVVSGGTQRIAFAALIPGMGLAPDKLWTCPPLMLLNGWDFTLQRLTGSDRTIEYSIKAVEGAVTEAFTGTDTVGATEFYIASASTTKTSRTTAGVYQVFLDLNALAKSDDFELKMYEKVRAASAADAVGMDLSLKGLRTLKIYATPSLHLANGWEFSLKKLAGTDQSIPHSIRKVA